MASAADALIECMKKHGEPMNMRDLLLAKFCPGMQPEWLNNLLRELCSTNRIVRGKDPDTGYLVFSLTPEEEG
jgi:hypothetical protein